MAEYTRQLVKQNGWEELVTVLQGRAEEIELPEQVDVLVSEWMGNCLLVMMTTSPLLIHVCYCELCPAEGALSQSYYSLSVSASSGLV